MTSHHRKMIHNGQPSANPGRTHAGWLWLWVVVVGNSKVACLHCLPTERLPLSSAEVLAKHTLGQIGGAAITALGQHVRGLVASDAGVCVAGLAASCGETRGRDTAQRAARRRDHSIFLTKPTNNR